MQSLPIVGCSGHGRIRAAVLIQEYPGVNVTRTAGLLQERVQHIRVDAQDPAAEDIDFAAEIMKSGGLVAFPTETVYGLGAIAWEASAVDKIFRVKGRPPNDPLIVHIAAIDQLSAVAREIPDLACELGRHFWPGPLTLVLKKSARIPANLTAGLDTVAVRLPDHPVASALLKAVRAPIAAPSANRFSRPSPTTAQHVLDDLGDMVDLLLDAGPTTIGLESTIISLVGDSPQVLRPGGLSLEALRRFLPELGFSPHFLGEDEAALAPGSLLKHYSPRARLIVFQGGDDSAVRAAMRAEIAGNQNIGVMAGDADASAFSRLDVKIERLGKDDEGAANRLFAAMRALDQQGVDLIIARAPEKRGLGLAVWDRLLRAAEGSLVEV